MIKKQRHWQIPAFFLLVLYLVLGAALAWLPQSPSRSPAPTQVPSATPTAQYTAAPRPVAWVVLPTNTPRDQPPPTEEAPADSANAKGRGDTAPTESQAASTGTPTPSPSPQSTPTALPTASAPEPSPSPEPTLPATPTLQPTAAPTATQTAAPRTHTVKAGDTLSAIAKQYGVTVKAIVEANNLASADSLDIDQVLTIPAPAQPSPTASP